MEPLQISRTQFKVSDFLGWQRDGTLRLSPSFQRRSVWKADAKSYLVDTVARGLPTPIIFLRARVDLESQSTIREVVDGQQRLRTLISYIDPSALGDYQQDRDYFEIKPTHSPELGKKRFAELDKEIRRQILDYEFSTHTLPSSMDDRAVLQMFARLNSTGVKLNGQELRNAEFFGEFKTVMYELAVEQLARWRRWKVFSEDDIARMREVELVSDLVKNMIDGLSGKTQKALDEIYGRFDDGLPHKRIVEKRFETTMDQIDDLVGQQIPLSVYRSEVYFFTLFTFVYDTMWGLGSSRDTSRPKPVAKTKTRNGLMRTSEKFQTQDVPADVLDAVQRASADLGRRRTRLRYVRKICA